MLTQHAKSRFAQHPLRLDLDDLSSETYGISLTFSRCVPNSVDKFRVSACCCIDASCHRPGFLSTQDVFVPLILLLIPAFRSYATHGLRDAHPVLIGWHSRTSRPSPQPNDYQLSRR